MRISSRGIAPTVIVVILVVIIAAAAAGVYFSGVLNPSSNTTNGSTSTTIPPSTSSTSSASSSLRSTSSSSPTSTSSASSSSSQSATTTVSTVSCGSTYTTTTGTPVDYTPQYINLVAKFSAISFSISGTTNGTSYQNSSISYHRTTVSSGIYDATITLSTNSGSASYVARVDSNNQSVISVSYSGYTFYGAQAKGFFDGFMAIFGLEETFGGYVSVLTSPTYFHSTGTASATYGSTTFDVTTWVANTLPIGVNECGYSATITAFTLKDGTPPGTSLTFITYLHFASSSPTNEDITLQLVSMTEG